MQFFLRNCSSHSLAVDLKQEISNASRLGIILQYCRFVKAIACQRFSGCGKRNSKLSHCKTRESFTAEFSRSPCSWIAENRRIFDDQEVNVWPVGEQHRAIPIIPDRKRPERNRKFNFSQVFCRGTIVIEIAVPFRISRRLHVQKFQLTCWFGYV
jgi:hypothetical protein